MFGYFIIFIILLVVSKCSCIGKEYYDDMDFSEEKQQQSTSTPDARRIGNDENLEILDDSNGFTNYPSYSVPNAEMSDYSVPHYIMNRKKSSLGPTCKGLSGKQNNYSNYSDFIPPFSITTEYTTLGNSSSTIFPSDIFKEYEYIYEDSKQSQILRQDISNVESNTKTTKLGDFSFVKTSHTEFYNLEPAVQHVNLEVYQNYSRSNTWYSLGDLPCWDLPLLYAELGRKKRTSNVFLIHGGKLKNVHEASRQTVKQSRKPQTPSETYYTNKWCTVEPCYGDHTLCLFSDKSLSGLCPKDYKVQRPSISEQTALVNTINSMRNLVANGESQRYSHLPSAANMKQIMYDYDLEKIAKVWLYQCLPGPAPCSALDENFVTQLECTKYAEFCCVTAHTLEFTKCIPKTECFVLPVIGCLHIWFWSAGDNITATDVQCGHTSTYTYNTAQILWAKTYKIGCAYAQNNNGDVRVICNFSPGAPFYLNTELYCGILSHNDSKSFSQWNITEKDFLKSVGIYFNHKTKNKERNITETYSKPDIIHHKDILFHSGVDILSKMYTKSWVRKELQDYSNGTKAMIARLVIKYKFTDESESRCDSDESIYISGDTGSLCVERGRRYQGLCYDFRDPTPGYRLVAVVAPIALFSLILYDLFSGVVRQTNY